MRNIRLNSICRIANYDLFFCVYLYNLVTRTNQTVKVYIMLMSVGMQKYNKNIDNINIQQKKFINKMACKLCFQRDNIAFCLISDECIKQNAHVVLQKHFSFCFPVSAPNNLNRNISSPNYHQANFCLFNLG